LPSYFCYNYFVLNAAYDYILSTIIQFHRSIFFRFARAATLSKTLLWRQLMRRHTAIACLAFFSFALFCLASAPPALALETGGARPPLVLFCGQESSLPFAGEGAAVSSDPSVVCVRSDGTAEALRPGACVLALLQAGEEPAEAVLAVVVRAPLPRKIAVAKGEMALKEGERSHILASFLPGNALLSSLSYTSLDPKIASVGEDGSVEAHRAGKTEILVEASRLPVAMAGGGPARVAVKVAVSKAQESLEMGGEVSLAVGESAQIPFLAYPEPTDGFSPSFSSSNPSVASVGKGGEVQGVSAGTAVIRAAYGESEAFINARVEEGAEEAEAVSLPFGSLGLFPGQSAMLEAALSPEGALSTSLSWTSSNAKVATVEGGVVRAISPGEATVAASSIGGASAIVEVHVAQSAYERIDVIQPSLSLAAGSSALLEAATYPEGGSGALWSSSDETVAKVAPDGMVLALSPGSATLTAASPDGGARDEALVTVLSPMAQSLSLGEGGLSMRVGEKAALSAKALPEGSLAPAIDWSSSNPSVVSVDGQGRLAALSEGSAFITATAGNLSATREAAVYEVHAESISLSPSALLLDKGEKKKIYIKAFPGSSIPKGAAWSSSDEKVATVSPDGVVTAVGNGSAAVTCRIESGLEAKAGVRVSAKAKKVEAGKESVAVFTGESAPLSFSILPKDAESAQLSYSSSDPSVAVYKNGSVEGLKEGQAILSAKSADGPSASCRVTVSDRLVEEVAVKEASLSLTTGQKAALSWQALPESARNRSVGFSSSDPEIAEVGADGTVHARKEGKCVLTVTASDKGRKSASVAVEVADIAVESASGDIGPISMREGEEKPLKIHAVPESATNPRLQILSSDEGVALPYEGGVRAVKPGSAILSVVAEDSGKTVAKISVTVVFVHVESVAFDRPPSAIETGKSAQAQAAVLPKDASNPALRYMSSNPAVAAVSSDGTVAALKAGKAVVKAVSAENGALSASYEVECIQKVEKISASSSAVALHPKEKADFSYKVFPADTTDPSVSIFTSDPSKAVVEGNGAIRAVSAGICTITIRANDGSGASARIQVTVLNRDVASIFLEPRSFALYKGESKRVEAAVSPSNATVASVLFESLDPSVAMVDGSGEVTALKAGIAAIRAKAKDGSGVSDEISVAVLEKAQSVSAPPSITLFSGQNQKIGAAALPETASDRTLSYRSDDPAVAAVDSFGNVRALKPGKTKVEAMAKDGSGVSATVEIEVRKPVSEIYIEKPSVTVYTGEAERLGASALPADATDRGLAYASSDPLVAYVGEDGEVRGKKAGTATITATASDGSGAVAQAGVTVLQKVASLDIGPSSARMFVGESRRLKALALPADSSDKGVRWASSNLSVATVDSAGNVLALKAGSVVVTAVATDFGKVSSSVKLDVLQKMERLAVSKERIGLFAGETEKISLNTSPEDASNKGVSFSSSNPAVASVSSNGVVTAKAAGEADITVSASDGGGAKAKVKVSVTQLVTGLAVPEKPLIVYTGETADPKVRALPDNAALPSLVFASENQSVATVGLDGSVKGVKAGKAKISAYAADGSDVSASFDVEVRQRATNVAFQRTRLTLNVGEVDRMTAIVQPEDATVKKVLWSVSDSAVASVDASGNVAALSPGKAILRASSSESERIFAEAAITVVQKVSAVSFGQASVVLYTQDSYRQLASAVPKNASQLALRYKSDNPSVASVDSGGSVKALLPGKASITAFAADGGGASASYSVEVLQRAQSLSVPDKELRIYTGSSYKIEATVKPGDTTDKGLEYHSSDPKVAPVDEMGRITAKKAGNASIAVKTKDGSAIQTDIKVSVLQHVTAISAPKSIEANISEKPPTLSWSCQPEDASNKAVEAASLNPDVATVSRDGEFSLNKPGHAVIAVKAKDGGGAAAYVQLTVVRSVSSVEAPQSSLEMYVGAKTGLSARALPEDATNKKLSYRSSDPAVARVSEDGVVTGVSAGSAVIAASSDENGAVKCEVRVAVRDYSAIVALDRKSASLFIGESLFAAAEIRPSGKGGAPLAPREILWSTSDPRVAEVAEGRIEAKAAGKAVITAYTADKSCVAANMEVSVLEHVESITLDRPAVRLFVGDSVQLSAKISPAGASDPSLEWLSSDASVASVTAEGLVRAVGTGSAEITARSKESPGVAAAAQLISTQPVKSVAFEEASLTLYAGEKARPKTSIRPVGATEKSLAWTSSNPDIVSVSADGELEARKNGTAIVTAKASDSGGAYGALMVTVETKAAALSVSPSEIALVAGQSRQLSSSFAPEGAQKGPVSWKSSDASVAEVTEAGFVRAVKPGKARITASSGGLSGSAELTVLQPVTTVTPDSTYMSIAEGKSMAARFTVLPENATNPALALSSSNPKVATVDKAGLVQAVSPGACEILVRTTDGSNIEGRISVTVTKPVTSLDLGLGSLTLYVSEKYQLEPKLSEGAGQLAQNSVRYHSDNTEIASVSYKGAITAKKPGKCVITASTGDGSKKSDKVAVTVVRGIQEIVFSEKAKTLFMGAEYAVGHYIVPSNASQTAVLWQSSNPKVAEVDHLGHVKAVMPGFATITAVSTDGRKAQASIDLTVYRKVDSLAVDQSALSLHVGAERLIQAEALPTDATLRTIAWESSDPGVASVDGAGRVKAHSPGQAAITAKTTDGSGLSAKTEISVRQQASSLSVLKKNYAIAAGESDAVRYSLQPDDASEKSVSFTSSDTDVATVDAAGVIHAVKPGTAEILLRTLDGTGLSGSAFVTVAEVKLEGISLEESSLALAVGEKAQLHPAFEPKSSTSTDVRYTSSDPEVASVGEGGQVEALKPGKATITVESAEGGYSDTCAIESYSRVSAVALSRESLQMEIGQSFSLSAQPEPAGSGKGAALWRTSDPSVASVASDGTVLALKEGSCAVTAIYGSASARCRVDVKYRGVLIEKLSAPKEALGYVGSPLQMEAALFPAYANERVAYSSSNEEIASVSEGGIAVGHKPGSCEILAKSAKAQAVIKLTVSSFSRFPIAAEAHSAGSSSVALSWNTSDVAESYDVYRSGAAAGAYEKIGSVRGGSYTDTGLACGKEVWYKVRGVAKENGRTAFTDYSDARMARPIPATVSISSVEALSSEEASLLFTASEGADGYEIERSVDGGAYAPAGESLEGSFADQAPFASSSVFYRVRAYCLADGERVHGEWSEAAGAKTAPRAPRLSVESIGATQARAIVSGEGADGYFLYRSDEEGGPYSLVGSIEGSEGHFDNTGLACGQEYFYKAASYRLSGDGKVPGSLGDPVSVRPLPMIPVILNASRSESVALVSWRPVSGASGYEISWRSSSGEWAAESLEGPSVLSYTISAAYKEDTVVKIRAYTSVPQGKARSAYSSERVLKAPK
jgi:uncharacterized protein YjdB